MSGPATYMESVPGTRSSAWSRGHSLVDQQVIRLEIPMTYPPSFMQPIPDDADQLIQHFPRQSHLYRHLYRAQRRMTPRELFHQVNVIGRLDVPLNAYQAGMRRELCEEGGFP